MSCLLGQVRSYMSFPPRITLRHPYKGPQDPWSWIVPTLPGLDPDPRPQGRGAVQRCGSGPYLVHGRRTGTTDHRVTKAPMYDTKIQVCTRNTRRDTQSKLKENTLPTTGTFHRRCGSTPYSRHYLKSNIRYSFTHKGKGSQGSFYKRCIVRESVV